MKRVLDHPDAPATGRRYWRGVEEYAQSEEFHGWLEREFPQGAAEFWGDGVSRRSFLRLMGASVALAGLGLSGCRRPEAYLVSYTKSPEWQIPGKNLFFTAAAPRPRGALPLLVTSFDGRPIKVDGNPEHPVVQGKSDAHAQASILDLYDPDRAKRYLNQGQASTKADFETALTRIREVAQSNGGAGLAVLADETLSPTRDRLRQELLQQFPQMTWSVFEPLVTGNQAAAVKVAFGIEGSLSAKLLEADVVLAIGADFLGSDDFGFQAQRDFTKRRKIEKPGDKMNRLYAVENHFTNTGIMAEHRLRLPASHYEAFAAALANELGVTGLPLGVTGGLTGVDPLWIKESAADLRANAGRSVVLAGPNTSVELQLIVLAINQALGNLGQTLNVVPAPFAKAESIDDLAAKIESGTVETLLVLGGNPAFNAPAHLEFGKLLGKVATSIYLASHENETSSAATWTVPSTHYLEAWSDGLAEDGSYLTSQPLILPLWGGVSQLDLLALLAGRTTPEGPELIKETFALRSGTLTGTALDDAWNIVVHDGFAKENGKRTRPSVAFQADSVASFLENSLAAAPKLGDGNLEVVLARDYSLDDGRYANNGWMQEFPDPVTKLTWGNAILVSPNTAKALGLRSFMDRGIQTGDTVRVSVNGATVEGPILVAPGHADNSLTIPVGYGAKLGRVSSEGGFSAYPLRTSSASLVYAGAKLEKLGPLAKLAVTQEHQSMEGRALVREAPLAEFEKNPEFVKLLGVEAHAPKNFNFYQVPAFESPMQWGMSIDLTTCTGCSACVVACQSENNIPIVGPEQVKNGREMHWIRLDRYFVSEDFNTDKVKGFGTPDPIFAVDPEAVVQPVTCMHCENAPCETVCPVNATVHSEEGLNVMAYNRCIGTRYCANNCPYKVRRFNFFDYNKRDVLSRSDFLGIGNLYFGPFAKKGSPDTIKMQKNPNVSVRMRGVMEKCTFCVQRIEEAKIETLVKARDSSNTIVPKDSFQTACQQACPTDAIVFGDIKQADSAVAKRKALPHDYAMLGYLNVRPRVTYLGRIRNPNPNMPGADRVGMSLLKDVHHHDDHGSGYGKDAHGGKH
jgi:molybdopterin-containing oxidoreductase family iron-sulfur binding subunit